MDWVAILALVLFGALLVAFLSFLRRASALVGRIRDHEQAQREVADLEQRVALAIDPLLGRIEDVRHHRAQADGLAALLPTSAQAVAGLRKDVKALRLPPGFSDVLAPLPDALEKAERAIRLIEHGADALANARGGPRELEAQTSLKRGALALRNARADAGEVAHRVAALPPPQAARRLGAGTASRSRSRGGLGSLQVVPPPPTTLLPPDGGAASLGRTDRPSDPSM